MAWPITSSAGECGWQRDGSVYAEFHGGGAPMARVQYQWTAVDVGQERADVPDAHSRHGPMPRSRAAISVMLRSPSRPNPRRRSIGLRGDGSPAGPYPILDKGCSVKCLLSCRALMARACRSLPLLLAVSGRSRWQSLLWTLGAGQSATAQTIQYSDLMEAAIPAATSRRMASLHLSRQRSNSKQPAGIFRERIHFSTPVHPMSRENRRPAEFWAVALNGEGTNMPANSG